MTRTMTMLTNDAFLFHSKSKRKQKFNKVIWSADDKKRVILESESSKEHALDMTKVTSSVRMLGSGFFHDVTGIKKAKGKIYDAHTMYTEEYDESEAALVTEEWDEESWIEQLAADGDEDAVLICEYESAIPRYYVGLRETP